MYFFSWLRNPKRTNLGQSRRMSSAPRPRSTFRPRLEALENRCVPSTLQVTNTADSGPGSLRYEIAQAQSNDTILFNFGRHGNINFNNYPHTITLTSGELDIRKNLTIQGPGAGLLTVASTRNLTYGDVSRIFEVEPGVTNATLSGMTISNGVGVRDYNGDVFGGDYYDGTGGGVLNLGTLRISGCILFGNSASSAGGGIANLGTLTMSACTLANNYLAIDGGGIFNSGTLTMSACTLSNNFCTGSGDGGGHFQLRHAGPQWKHPIR